MADKSKYPDRIILKCGLTKFDALFSSNDGGEYSPSIRRLRQQYLHDTKCFSGKVVSTPSQLSSAAAVRTQVNEHTHPSSADLMSTGFKCDDCRENDGLFQCCHCNQRLCIRCCNKHYKKVTVELDHLHQLSDHLVTRIIQTNTDLERQKDESIEQCHQWRIDTINAINKGHTLIIQTIDHEYQILRKEYDSFVDQEMAQININNNEFRRMKKGNLGSLLSSPSPSTTSTIDLTKSIDAMKTRIAILTKYLDDISQYSLQVHLPTFILDDNLRVESRFGDNTRSTSAVWLDDNTREMNTTSSYGSLHRVVPSIDRMNSDNEDIYKNAQSKSEQDQTTEGQKPTALPIHSMNISELGNDHSWLYQRTTLSPF